MCRPAAHSKEFFSGCHWVAVIGYCTTNMQFQQLFFEFQIPSYSQWVAVKDICCGVCTFVDSMVET